MKPFTLPNFPPNASIEQKLNAIIEALRDIERASNEDPVEVFDAYSSNDTATVTREINVSSPSTSNLAAVLATLVADMQRRGVKRSG